MFVHYKFMRGCWAHIFRWAHGLLPSVSPFGVSAGPIFSSLFTVRSAKYTYDECRWGFLWAELSSTDGRSLKQVSDRPIWVKQFSLFAFRWLDHRYWHTECPKHTAQIGLKDAVQESSLHGNDQLLEKRVERRDAKKYRPEGLWIWFC